MANAVIFDMDGVISDTVGLHIKTESEFFRKLGIKLSRAEILGYNGVSDNEYFSAIFKKFGKKESVENAIRYKWDMTMARVKGRLKPIPGAVEFAGKLKSSGLKLGVASASRKDFIELVVSELGMSECFDALTSSDEVSAGKPDPAVFLLTAKKLGVKPWECLVIEDGPKGVQAAKSGGMKCVAITTTHARKELLGADMVVDSFGELSVEKIKNI